MNGGVMQSQRNGTVTVTGGTIDGTTIGATTPAAITGTTITGTVITATTKFVGPILDTAGTQIDFQIAATNRVRVNVAGLDLGNSGSRLIARVATLSNDSSMSIQPTGVLELRNANVPQQFDHYAGNGGFHSFVAFNEQLTIAAAATTDSTTTIPAGAQIVAVSVRVTTVVPTAATFTVTAATGGTTFSTAAVAVAAGSTDPGTAAGGATYTSAGTKIRITPNLTPGAATGVVRICGYYRLVTPPTS